MDFAAAFRDGRAAGKLATAIEAAMSRPWTIMEVCGGQTHAIMRYGLDGLLPPALELCHGPGCPVCVTPAVAIDEAVTLAITPGVALTTFGDMLRIPGEGKDLMQARAAGGDVRIVHGPLDAVAIAEAEPAREVVFFAIGFETTAPAIALAARQAADAGLRNFSLLTALVLAPPAMAAILQAPDNRIQGFLAPGHVATIAGGDAYVDFAARWRVPVVVTGFEPLDILDGVLRLVRRLEAGVGGAEIQYDRAVGPAGNIAAQSLVAEMFEPVDAEWRGLGVIPASGLRLRPRWAHLDARRRFEPAPLAPSVRTSDCRAADVLRGAIRPTACPAFGRSCTPERPLGAPMASTEGACAAYARYGDGAHDAGE